jgi:hypothetical protein
MSGIECALFGTLGDDATVRTGNSGKPYLRVRVRVGEGDGGQWLSALVSRAPAEGNEYGEAAHRRGDPPARAFGPQGERNCTRIGGTALIPLRHSTACWRR